VGAVADGGSNGPILVVVSAPDPVASRVAERWGTPPATGAIVDGAPIRQLAPSVLLLKRPGRHIHDERLDRRLPSAVVDQRPTLVFPSIHRSEQGVPCLTVHPLGNLGPTAEVGGRPRTVVPTDPRRMASTLRTLRERGERSGLAATYEATHHGPELALPGYFVEIGFGDLPEPPLEAVRVLAESIPTVEPDAADRVAVAIGGGHYAPHFTDLTVRRRWAFGHIVSRHSLDGLDRPTAEAVVAATPGSEGFVYSRAADQVHPALQGLAARKKDTDAPPRERPDGPISRAGSPASGT
jgi:D-tyrosyl-tRNA(Tyr) deacylase